MNNILTPRQRIPTLPNAHGRVLRLGESQPRPPIAPIPFHPARVIRNRLAEMEQRFPFAVRHDAELVDAGEEQRLERRFDCVCAETGCDQR